MVAESNLSVQLTELNGHVSMLLIFVLGWCYYDAGVFSFLWIGLGVGFDCNAGLVLFVM